MRLPFPSTIFFRQRPIVAAASLLLSTTLVGCGLGGVSATQGAATSLAANAVTITGKVHGGLQPVSGALVQLYEVGATGYGSAAKPILTTTVTTTPQGFFSITGDYTCDAGSYVYITAAGGNAGAGTNNNIALMAALGSCSRLKANAATTYIFMNEVTTVAAAYALAQFSGGTAFGTALTAKPGSGGTALPADNFATSTTNVQGVANAMAIANVLANTATGTSPGSNTNNTATVENYTVNTIADILSTCVNSTGGAAGSSTPCGRLFTSTTPTGGTAPADTIQAALQLALHPGDAALLAGTPSGSTLDALITAQPPYLPYINTSVAGNTINDWTIAVSYAPVTPSSTATLLSKSNEVAIDGFGNAWITNIGNNAVVELAPNGDPIQAGSTTGLYSVNSYNVSGTATNVSGGGTATGSFYGIAIDNENNAWAADLNGGYLFKIGASTASFGVNGEVAASNGGGGTAATSLAASYTTAPQSGSHPVGIAIDGADTIYTALYGNGGTAPTGAAGATCGGSSPYTAGTKNLVTFAKASGTYGTGVIGSAGGSNQTFIAIDNGNSDVAGSATIPGAPFVWTIGEASASGETHPSGGTAGHYGLLYQNYTVTNSTAGSIQGCATPLGSITSAGYTGSATTKVAQNANGGNTTDLINNAYSVAFDAANNLWMANQLPTDTNGTYAASLTKFTPSYGSTFTSANAAANSTFTTYTSGGLLASGFKPFAIAIDGSGSVFASNNSTKAIVAAVSNTGAAVAPATGFIGATYSPDGTSTEFARPFTASAGLAIDLSGNLWVTSGNATTAVAGPPAVASVPATNIVQIVGVAAPVVAPFAAAVNTGKLGVKP